MGKLAVLLIVVVLAACGSTAGSASSTLGATVTVNSGVAVTPAGVTRTDFDKVAKALDAKDTTGVAELVTAGQVVVVDQCATAKVIDTAAGGERQLRILTDDATPANVGQALWVDVNWVKDAKTVCP